ncbi:gtp-binding protein alpha subunit [Anaeramoeba flamelloides]|uniref:Gtp-binding protein alpha subunit n=1 Tax=Anaeramoeba flamelloides TaxID=1746091 RepID=A0AAV7ZAB9_9EUKA|nr:gtp-binding protein alpha subunit [Anaeramoeba flamelloides]
MGNKGTTQNQKEVNRSPKISKLKRRRSARIDKMLIKDQLRRSKEFSILVFGNENISSGVLINTLKRTKKYSQSKIEQLKPKVITNFLGPIVSTIRSLDPESINENTKKSSNYLKSLTTYDQMNYSKIYKNLKTIWKDQSVQKQCLNHHNRNVIKYFFNNYERYFSEEFELTLDDVLISKNSYDSGVEKFNIKIDGIKLNIINVTKPIMNGKWLNIFDNVNLIIYCASLTDYNRQSTQIRNKNRLVETIETFGSICRLECLNTIPITLFLGQKQSFYRKLEKNKLSKFFKGFRSDGDSKRALGFIKKKFLTEAKKVSTDRKIFDFIIEDNSLDEISDLFRIISNLIKQEVNKK